MFQKFTLEHHPGKTVIYPFCDDYKKVCLYLEEDGTYVAHTKNSNKMGKLEKERNLLTLEDIQKLCALVL